MGIRTHVHPLEWSSLKAMVLVRIVTRLPTTNHMTRRVTHTIVTHTFVYGDKAERLE